MAYDRHSWRHFLVNELLFGTLAEFFANIFFWFSFSTLAYFVSTNLCHLVQPHVANALVLGAGLLLLVALVKSVPFDAGYIFWGASLGQACRSLISVISVALPSKAKEENPDIYKDMTWVAGRNTVRYFVYAFIATPIGGWIGALLPLLFLPHTAATLGRPWSNLAYSLAVRRVIGMISAAIVIGANLYIRGFKIVKAEDEQKKMRVDMQPQRISKAACLLVAAWFIASYGMSLHFTGGVGVLPTASIFTAWSEDIQCRLSGHLPGATACGFIPCHTPTGFSNMYYGCQNAVIAGCPESLTNVTNFTCSSTTAQLEIPTCAFYAGPPRSELAGFLAVADHEAFDTGVARYCWESTAWCLTHPGKGMQGSCTSRAFDIEGDVNATDNYSLESDGKRPCIIGSNKDVIWAQFDQLFGAIVAVFFLGTLFKGVRSADALTSKLHAEDPPRVNASVAIMPPQQADAQFTAVGGGASAAKKRRPRR